MQTKTKINDQLIDQLRMIDLEGGSDIKATRIPWMMKNGPTRSSLISLLTVLSAWTQSPNQSERFKWLI